MRKGELHKRGGREKRSNRGRVCLEGRGVVWFPRGSGDKRPCGKRRSDSAKGGCRTKRELGEVLIRLDGLALICTEDPLNGKDTHREGGHISLARNEK